jgi:hypothetical protein
MAIALLKIEIPKLDRKTILIAFGVVVALAAGAAPAVAAPAPAPAAMKAETPAADAPRRRSRAHEDARACLSQPTDLKIAACAEKFR